MLDEKTIKKHDAHLDLLRIAGAFAVVWLHVSASIVAHDPNIQSVAWWTGNIFEAMSRWCVPVFVMVSGALLLLEGVQIEGFYRRRAARLLPPLVFWTIFYICLRECGRPAPTAAVLLTSLVKGVPYFHLWYLYMVAGLYLVAPFLRQIVMGSSNKLLLLFIISGFVIAAIELTLAILSGSDSATFLTSFLPYIPYFVAGHYLYIQSSRTRPSFYLLCAFMSGILVASGAGALLAILGSKSWDVMYQYLNPIVIVMSVCVFRFGLDFQFRSNKFSTILRKLAPFTLGIYLVHPFWLAVLDIFGLNAFVTNPIIAIPMISLAAFGLSAASSILMGAIPFLRTTVR